MDKNSNALGLDLSRFNGRANWPAVKASGVDFVVIKFGGIYSNTGVCYTDDLAAEHVAGAKSVGIPFGGYWFFLPTPGTISKQISYYQKLFDQFNPTIRSAFIDAESNNGQAAPTVTNGLKTFVPAFSDMVDIAVIYTRQSWWDLNVLKDTWGGYWLWASRWASHLTSPWSDGNYRFRDWKNWLFWQYSGDNNAKAKNYGFPGNPPPGYSGDKYNYGDPDLDLNYFNGNKIIFAAWANLDTDPDPVPEEEELSVEETLKNHEFRIRELEKNNSQD